MQNQVEPRTVPRMEDLATLPVFFKLRGKKAIMAGGDLPAVWKVELLAAAGAQVSVFAEEPCHDMTDLAAALRPGAVTLVPRLWADADLAKVALAIGSIEDTAEAERFVGAARRAGVPVNVIDKPAFCDFQFGTIVARSPLVIGISTDGGAPVFGQAIRARIEALLPQGFRRWAQAAKDWRADMQAESYGFRQRRRFWEAFTARALEAPEREPNRDDFSACVAATSEAETTRKGRIVFVGCDPTRVGSLTLDAVAALQSADEIFYDAEIDDVIVAMGRREAPKIALPSDLMCAVAQIADRLRAGRHVAWLGGGDPLTAQVWRDRAAAFARNNETPGMTPGVVIKSSTPV